MMRYLWRYNFFIFIAAALMLVPALPAFAQGKIAVVNVQEIMSESLAAKSIQDQLNVHRKRFQEEFSQHERDLLEEQKSLAEIRDETSPEDFSKKRDEFESQLLATRKLVQKRQQALEQAAGDAIGKLRSEVLQIVADIADQNDYDMVVTKQNVVLAQKDMEITSEVMKRLDKNLKEIELNVETN